MRFSRMPPALLAVLATSGLSWSACGRDAAPESAPVDDAIAVTTAVAELTTLRDLVAVPGTAVPATTADWTVYAPEPATIAELPKVEGDAVAVGDLLVRFEIAAISQEVMARQSALVEANQRVGLAQGEVNKFRPLYERGLVARAEFESRQSELLAAQSAVTQAKAQLDVAQLQEERTVVRARFAGVVAGRWHQAGDVVVPGTTDPILRVIDPSQLQIAVQLSLAQFDRVRPGQTASVGVTDAGVTETATVSFAPRPTDPAATTGEIRLTPQPGSAVTLNLPVRVEILLEERPNALVVPEQALRREPSGSYVMVVDAENRARRREVRVGLSAQQLAQIVSGLMPGDRVITTALDLVEDGTLVRVSR